MSPKDIYTINSQWFNINKYQSCQSPEKSSGLISFLNEKTETHHSCSVASNQNLFFNSMYLLSPYYALAGALQHDKQTIKDSASTQLLLQWGIHTTNFQSVINYTDRRGTRGAILYWVVREGVFKTRMKRASMWRSERTLQEKVI